jgi:hypothetical protein
MPKALIVELVKLGIGAFFTYQRTKGLTDAEIDVLLNKLRNEVLEMDPYNLPQPVYDPSKD